MNIFQFTDIALYINNRSSDDLNKENAIKSLKISNMKVILKIIILKDFK